MSKYEAEQASYAEYADMETTPIDDLMAKANETAKAWGMNEGDLFKCEPYLQIKTADGSHAMWVPSIGDILAEDWQIIQ